MNEKSKSTLKEFLEKQAPAIKKALPAQIGYERFMRVAFTALSSSEKLQISIELTNAISADESVKTAIAFDMSLVENELTTEPGSLPPAALPIADPLNPATKVDTEMEFSR